MNSLTENEVLNILDCVMRNITNRVVNIQLCKQAMRFSGDTCTVHTKLTGGYDATLILYADTNLMTRLTQQCVQEEKVDPRDVEDFVREYFNVICGQVVSKLFQTTRVPSRFHIPCFCAGKYIPEQDEVCQYELNYTTCYNEGVQLIYQVPKQLKK